MKSSGVECEAAGKISKYRRTLRPYAGESRVIVKRMYVLLVI
jgi:hypothetical protein